MLHITQEQGVTDDAPVALTDATFKGEVADPTLRVLVDFQAAGRRPDSGRGAQGTAHREDRRGDLNSADRIRISARIAIRKRRGLLQRRGLLLFAASRVCWARCGFEASVLCAILRNPLCLLPVKNRCDV